MSTSNIKTNKFFAIFFAMYFILYQYKYIQLILFILLGLYVFNDFFKNKKYIIKKKEYKKYLLIFGWLGLFVLLSYVSKLWAIGVYPESRTLLTLTRMLYVGLMIFIYCDSKERAVSITKSYVFGVLIMCLTVLVLTPPIDYGNEFYFGKIISQHRNTIGNAAAESIVYMYLISKISKFSYKKILTVFFLFIILISGSRGAIVELLFFIGFYLLINLKKKKTYAYLLALFIIGIVTYIVITNVPYLYNTIYMRFINMVNTITGTTMADGSTYSRSLMKKIAFEIFKLKPVLGSGMDGYEVYLLNNPQNYGRNFAVVYSHCNYTEIASNYGIVGLLIWYLPLANAIKKTIINQKDNDIVKILFCILISIIFADIFRIPWTRDVSIFSYFIIMILIYFYCKKEA